MYSGRYHLSAEYSARGRYDAGKSSWSATREAETLSDDGVLVTVSLELDGMVTCF